MDSKPSQALWGGLIVCSCLVWLAFLVLQPHLQLQVRTVSPRTAAPPPVVLTSSNGWSETMQSAASPVQTTIKLEAREPGGAGRGSVQVSPLQSSRGGRICDPSSYRLKGWDFTPNWVTQCEHAAGRLVSVTPGSIAFIEGYLSNPYLQGARGPYEADLAFSADGTDQQAISFRNSQEDFVSFQLGSTAHVHYRNLPSYPAQMITTVEAKGSRLERVDLMIGPHTLRSVELGTDLRTAHIEVQWKDILVMALHLGRNWLGCIISSTAVLTLGFLIGYPLTRRWLSLEQSRIELIYVSCLTGLAILLSLASSLVYFVPLNTGLPILIVLLFILSLWLLRVPLKASRLLEAAPASVVLTPLAFALLVGTCHFFPVWYEGELSLGHAYSDSFDYIGWSEVLRRSSFLLSEIQPWRIGDLVFLSFFAIVTGSSTQIAYSRVAFLSWILLAPCVSLLAYRCTGRRKESIVTGAVVASWCGVTFIFSHGFFAQAVGTVLAFSTILMGTYALLSLHHSRSVNVPLIIGAAAVGAYLAGFYPYLAVGPVVLTFLLTLRAVVSRDVPALKTAALFSALLLLLVNLNLWVAFDLVAKSTHFEFINLLARSHVIPFYLTWEHVLVNLGLKDWVGNSARLDQLIPELGAGFPAAPEALQLVLHGTGYIRGFVASAILALAMYGVAFVIRKRNYLCSPLLLTTAILTVITGLLVFTDQVYSGAKFLLVMAAFIVFFAGLAIGHIFVHARAMGARLFMFALGLSFLVMNLQSAYIEEADAFIPRSSESLYRMKTHRVALSSDIARLDHYLERQPIPGAVVFLGTAFDLWGTDRDRVLYNRVLYAFRDASALWHGDGRHVFHSHLASLDYQGSLEMIDDLSAAVVFRGAKIPQFLIDRGFKPTFDAEYFSLYRIGGF